MPANRAPLEFYGHPLPGIDTSELQGKLIVIEGPDVVGRSTQIQQLRFWLEHSGYAVVDTGMARSALTMKGIQDAKNGHTLGPLTMGLFYMTDFADRLENVVIPALRAGFVVLTDRYIFSLIARAAARGQNVRWLEEVAGIALVPHATFYLRAEVDDLAARVVCGPGQFDYWESGMDVPYGKNRCDSFVKYQTKLIEILDGMAGHYNFKIVNAGKKPVLIFRQLQRQITRVLQGVEK